MGLFKKKCKCHNNPRKCKFEGKHQCICHKYKNYIGKNNCRFDGEHPCVCKKYKKRGGKKKDKNNCKHEGKHPCTCIREYHYDKNKNKKITYYSHAGDCKRESGKHKCICNITGRFRIGYGECKSKKHPCVCKIGYISFECKSNEHPCICELGKLYKNYEYKHCKHKGAHPCICHSKLASDRCKHKGEHDCICERGMILDLKCRRKKHDCICNSGKVSHIKRCKFVGKHPCKCEISRTHCKSAHHVCVCSKNVERFNERVSKGKEDIHTSFYCKHKIDHPCMCKYKPEKCMSERHLCACDKDPKYCKSRKHKCGCKKSIKYCKSRKHKCSCRRSPKKCKCSNHVCILKKNPNCRCKKCTKMRAHRGDENEHSEYSFSDRSSTSGELYSKKDFDSMDDAERSKYFLKKAVRLEKERHPNRKYGTYSQKYISRTDDFGNAYYLEINSNWHENPLLADEYHLLVDKYHWEIDLKNIPKPEHMRKKTCPWSSSESSSDHDSLIDTDNSYSGSQSGNDTNHRSSQSGSDTDHRSSQSDSDDKESGSDEPPTYEQATTYQV